MITSSDDELANEQKRQVSQVRLSISPVLEVQWAQSSCSFPFLERWSFPIGILCPSSDLVSSQCIVIVKNLREQFIQCTYGSLLRVQKLLTYYATHWAWPSVYHRMTSVKTQFETKNSRTSIVLKFCEKMHLSI